MKINLTELTQTLNDFTRQHNLKEEAVRMCTVAMTNCLQEDASGLDGLSIEEIKLEFISYELSFEHYRYESPFVKTRIGLYRMEVDDAYMRNHAPLGYYQLDTNLSGEHIDDWLVID